MVSPPRVRISIDRLVLDAIAPGDLVPIRAAFERELRALVLADAERLGRANGIRVRRTHAPYAAPPLASPHAVGRALARAVYAGIAAR